jgi:hypothetical protein
MDREHLGAGVGGLVGDQGDGLGGHLDRVVDGLGHREGEGERAEQLTSDRVVGVGREMVELLPDDAQCSSGVTGSDQRVADEPDQARVVEVRDG